MDSLLNKLSQSDETYNLLFDFAEVDNIEAGNLLVCKMLQRTGTYTGCFALGDNYTPKIGDKGLLLFAGKVKYPCFWSFLAGSFAVELKSGEIKVASAPQDVKVSFSNISAEFKTKINSISQEVGMNPDWLLLVLYFESGFSPTIHSPTGTVGLMQWTGARASEDGTTKDALQQMTVLQQVDVLRIDFLRAKGRLKSIYDVAMWIFRPEAVGKGADFKFSAPQDGMNTPREYVNKVIAKAKHAGFAVDSNGTINVAKNGTIELISNQNIEK